MTVPELEDGTSAYDFTVPESWKEIKSSDNGSSLEFIYAYVDGDMLITVYPDNATVCSLPRTDGHTRMECMDGSQ